MAELIYNEKGRLLFTEEMKKEYTILIPMMLPIHFALLEKIFITQVLVFYINYRKPIWIAFWAIIGAAAGTMTAG